MLCPDHGTQTGSEKGKGSYHTWETIPGLPELQPDFLSPQSLEYKRD